MADSEKDMMMMNHTDMSSIVFGLEFDDVILWNLEK